MFRAKEDIVSRFGHFAAGARIPMDKLPERVRQDWLNRDIIEEDLETEEIPDEFDAPPVSAPPARHRRPRPQKGKDVPVHDEE